MSRTFSKQHNPQPFALIFSVRNMSLGNLYALSGILLGMGLLQEVG